MMKSHVTSSPRRPRIGFAGACFFAAVLLTVSMLSGCGGPEPKAPEPTVNPHPHKFTKLKISVEPGSGVTGVKVESLWTVGNLGCASHQGWPSGASITKQVNTWEKVEKIDTNDYVATIIDDRFVPGKCKWNGGVYDIRFMHGNMVFSHGGAEPSDFQHSNKLELTCKSQEIPPFPPECFMRNQEAFFKARHYQIFNATVEIEK